MKKLFWITWCLSIVEAPTRVRTSWRPVGLVISLKEQKRSQNGCLSEHLPAHSVCSKKDERRGLTPDVYAISGCVGANPRFDF